MQSSKITKEEIDHLRVSSLPTRPASDRVYGGEGYSAEEIKAAFDRLPMHIVDVLNALIDDIKREGEESVAASIPTGLGEGHTLYDLFCDLRDGYFASYIKIGDESLPVIIARLSERCGL